MENMTRCHIDSEYHKMRLHLKLKADLDYLHEVEYLSLPKLQSIAKILYKQSNGLYWSFP